MKTTTDLKVLTRDQANARKPSTTGKIAEVNGYCLRTLQIWRKRFDDFPKPVAYLDNRPFRQQFLFDVREVLQWMEDAKWEGKIHNR